ncbi:MAG: hypothetical protein HKN81_06355 [Gammaproteobacteria bacterium]|nr:hypothetical protein [Gammaproteobacteria bacterium]
MKNPSMITCLAVFLALFATALPAKDDNPMDYQWTIAVDGKSASAGKIVLKLTSAPNEDGTTSDPVEMENMVAAKTKQGDLQKTLLNNVRAALGDERYQIKKQGSDRVYIKAKKGTPWFLLELTNNTVKGVAVTLTKK